MQKQRWMRWGALGLAAFTLSQTAGAQTQQNRAQVQLAFGHECGDRFLVRNDGAQAADIEYAVRGSTDRMRMHLNPKESAAIMSAADAPVELWVNGKRVASEAKGNRACAATEASADVVVRPLDQQQQQQDQVVYVEQAPPTRVVYVSAPPYYAYDPYYSYPYYGPSVSLSVGVPFYSGFGYTRYVRAPGPVFRGPVVHGPVIGRGHGRR